MHIKIDLKIFAFLILFCITRQIEIYVILMIFAIMHELGHMCAGILLKLKPKKIELNPFGLAITFEGIGEEFNKNVNQKKILIAFAGPLVNLIFVILFLLIPIGAIKMPIIYANLILLLVNLLPIYPLDGGRILRSILHIKLGHFESYEITNKISNIMVILLTVIASLSIFYFENIAILFIIAYLILLTVQENRKFALVKKTYEIIGKG